MHFVLKSIHFLYNLLYISIKIMSNPIRYSSVDMYRHIPVTSIKYQVSSIKYQAPSGKLQVRKSLIVNRKLKFREIVNARNETTKQSEFTLLGLPYFFRYNIFVSLFIPLPSIPSRQWEGKLLYGRYFLISLPRPLMACLPKPRRRQGED